MAKPKTQPRAAVWPADKIERWPVDDILPYERNARVHSPEQIEQIARSIREFGFTMPILVAEGGTIIAGHGRLEAAQKLGLDEVPVIIARGWTDEQRRAYTIADNQIALNSTWDDDLLRVELGNLGAEEFDLELLGFDSKSLAGLLAAPEPEPEPAPPSATLAERFGIPPFTVLRAAEGWWQDRKRAWLSLGIQSELGRGEQLIPNGGGLTSKARYDGQTQRPAGP